MIVYKDKKDIDGRICVSVFSHDSGEIGVHVEPKSTCILIAFSVKNAASAREIAALLIAAADAVDSQPKQAK